VRIHEVFCACAEAFFPISAGFDQVVQGGDDLFVIHCDAFFKRKKSRQTEVCGLAVFLKLPATIDNSAIHKFIPSYRAIAFSSQRADCAACGAPCGGTARRSEQNFNTACHKPSTPQKFL
jgi:hypothetical protein